VAPSRAAVDAFHSAALLAGGRDNGAPGLRIQYGPDYYAAFIIDPDGCRIEAYYGPAESRGKPMRRGAGQPRPSLRAGSSVASIFLSYPVTTPRFGRRAREFALQPAAPVSRALLGRLNSAGSAAAANASSVWL